MIKAMLNGANLENVVLTNADLTDADIWGTNFKNTKLQGANMNCKRIEEADFSGAEFDENTKWPQFFNPTTRAAISC